MIRICLARPPLTAAYFAAFGSALAGVDGTRAIDETRKERPRRLNQRGEDLCGSSMSFVPNWTREVRSRRERLPALCGADEARIFPEGLVGSALLSAIRRG